MQRVLYDTKIYNFRDKISKYLSHDNLEDIHKYNKFNGLLTDSNGDNPDQGQTLHKMFYREMDKDHGFKLLYDRFVMEIIKPLFSGEIIFQTYPTFRVHQPDNICVFDWHKDTDFNHNEKEINIFMPITDAYETNTIWVEYNDSASPIEAKYGEIILWDGANLKHGNKINETKKSRVSLDFRILPYKYYNEDSCKSSISIGRKFTIGSYFDERII